MTQGVIAHTVRDFRTHHSIPIFVPTCRIATSINFGTRGVTRRFRNFNALTRTLGDNRVHNVIGVINYDGPHIICRQTVISVTSRLLGGSVLVFAGNYTSFPLLGLNCYDGTNTTGTNTSLRTFLNNGLPPM